MDTAKSIYRDIATRTGGDIYIGVVGPVRTGKSTLIKRFMETLILPEIEDMYIRERARDELPQSGSGRTIMTAEPKFVPEEAITLSLGEESSCSIRFVDCVGFIVPGATGQTEDGQERLVTTPWYDHEIPMTQAAQEGTRRVIRDHSTVSIMVTTDGSVCGIPREDYISAEERTANELIDIGKPFITLLNCADPRSEAAIALSQELEAKYGAACIPVNCQELQENELSDILKKLLYEFPLNAVCVYLPGWVEALRPENELKTEIFSRLVQDCECMHRLCDGEKLSSSLCQCEHIQSAAVQNISPGEGTVSLEIKVPQELYYDTISRESGFKIQDDASLIELLHSVSSLKDEYERVHEALSSVRSGGYGIIMPDRCDLRLEEPEVVRQGSRYGVKLKASAPAIHMFMTNIETEVSPALGGEKASDEILSFLLQGFDGDMSKIWDSNLFGKPLCDIAAESVSAKIGSIPTQTRTKLQQTLQRIVNEGSGGLICILL